MRLLSHARTIFTFGLSMALVASAPAAFAGEGCEGQSVVSRIFEEADADASGDLTADEYAAAGLEWFGVSFEQSDLDGNGVTTLDEYLELYEAHHPPYAGEEI